MYREVLSFAVAIAVMQPAMAPLQARQQVVVRVGWDDARTTLAHGAFFQKIHVWTGPGQSRPIKGKLIEVTEDGLRVAQGKRETFIGQAELHSLRLFPRKTVRRQNRNIATVLAIPVGLLSMLGGWALGCMLGRGCSESGRSALGAVTIPAAGIGVPYLLYKRAWKKDRGSVLIVIA